MAESDLAVHLMAVTPVFGSGVASRITTPRKTADTRVLGCWGEIVCFIRTHDRGRRSVMFTIECPKQYEAKITLNGCGKKAKTHGIVVPEPPESASSRSFR